MSTSQSLLGHKQADINNSLIFAVKGRKGSPWISDSLDLSPIDPPLNNVSDYFHSGSGSVWKNIIKKGNSALKLELLGIKTDHVRLTGEVLNRINKKWTY